MTKNSMAGLSEKLQQQLKSDQEAANSQSLNLLKQHEASLKKLLSDELNTTGRAISAHAQALKALHTSTLQRLRWLMLWPVLATFLLCLLMLAGAMLWSAWTVSQADAQVQQKQQQIKQAEATFCATPVGLKVCKTPLRSQ